MIFLAGLPALVPDTCPIVAAPGTCFGTCATVLDLPLG